MTDKNFRENHFKHLRARINVFYCKKVVREKYTILDNDRMKAEGTTAYSVTDSQIYVKHQLLLTMTDGQIYTDILYTQILYLW